MIPTFMFLSIITSITSSIVTTYDKTSNAKMLHRIFEFQGPSKESEPETKAIGKTILEHKDNIRVYLTLHSYGRLIPKVFLLFA